MKLLVYLVAMITKDGIPYIAISESFDYLFVSAEMLDLMSLFFEVEPHFACSLKYDGSGMSVVQIGSRYCIDNIDFFLDVDRSLKSTEDGVFYNQVQVFSGKWGNLFLGSHFRYKEYCILQVRGANKHRGILILKGDTYDLVGSSSKEGGYSTQELASFIFKWKEINFVG